MALILDLSYFKKNVISAKMTPSIPFIIGTYIVLRKARKYQRYVYQEITFFKSGKLKKKKKETCGLGVRSNLNRNTKVFILSALSFMYPVGIEAMAEAVNLVAQERAPVIKQSEEGATYDAMLNKPELCKINFGQPARKIHDFIRGLDSVPGASGVLNGQETKFFGSKLWHGEIPPGTEVQIEGCAKPGIVHEKGLLIFGRVVCMQSKCIKDMLEKAHQRPSLFFSERKTCSFEIEKFYCNICQRLLFFFQ